MKVIREKIENKLKQLESMDTEVVENKIIAGYEISFLKKCYEFINTESLTVEHDKKLNDLKKEGLKRAITIVMDAIVEGKS